MSDETVNETRNRSDFDIDGASREQQPSFSQSQGQQRGRTTRPHKYVRNLNFRSRRKVCAFCVDKVRSISWKEADNLRRFIGDDGSIRARRKTGTCAKHQRRLAVAVKRARHLALLPFTGEHIRLSNKN